MSFKRKPRTSASPPIPDIICVERKLQHCSTAVDLTLGILLPPRVRAANNI